MRNKIYKIAKAMLAPIVKSSTFFTFMYCLGVLCLWLAGWQVSGVFINDCLELFFDLYILCTFLALVPRKVSSTLKCLLYIVFYSVAIVDLYCVTKFDSALSPTILLLMLETDTREASEFISSCLSSDVLLGSVGIVLCLILANIIFILRRYWIKYLRLSNIINRVSTIYSKHKHNLTICAGTAMSVLLIVSAVSSFANKQAMVRLMTGGNIGTIEHELTKKDAAKLYLPIYRLAFSIYSNSLISKQIDTLVAVSKKSQVDSCAFTSPNIVLIIGESYNRHHSAQYGYYMPTTPRQMKRARQGNLVPFTNVVSPWNLTSFVFKHMFSTYVVGDKGEWCDYPLFTQLFKKAGYHVTFITNQFLPKKNDAVYDFSGGFFLNNEELSKMQFDTRNTKLHQFDEDLLTEYDSLKKQNTNNNLIIFHLIGQHVNYRQRSPKDRKKFKADDYKELKPNLSKKERTILADYDNAILYNDSIVDQIIKRFEHQNAIVIYVPDHGEECYEGDMHFFCRMHSAQIDYRLAHAEFDIPFWIYISRKYAITHPDVVSPIKKARNKRYMTDALPHLLLYLGGIKTPAYKEKNNILSPQYNEMRKRLLKHTTDYDALKPTKKDIIYKNETTNTFKKRRH